MATHAITLGAGPVCPKGSQPVEEKGEYMTVTNNARLQDIFRTVLHLPSTADVSRLRQDEVEEWDSVAHVWIITAIESEFSVAIDIGESLAINSFESARSLLRDRGVE
jgi:acyl carrier protein